MSHVATGKLRVTSLDDLEVAAARLGLTLHRGQQTFTWYGRIVGDTDSAREIVRRMPASEWGKCQHALSVDGVDGAYEIGVVQALDGGEGYDLVFDAWSWQGRAITDRCGPQLEKLAEEVGAEAAMRIMARKGYRTERIVENGHVNVIATKN